MAGHRSRVCSRSTRSLVSRGAENELLPACRFNGLAVIPWSPLGGGILTGKYTEEAAAPPGSRAAQASPLAEQLRSRLDERVSRILGGVRAGCR